MQIACSVVLFPVCHLHVPNNNCIIYLTILSCVEDSCGLGRYIWDTCRSMYIALQKADVTSKLHGLLDLDDLNSHRPLCIANTCMFTYELNSSYVAKSTVIKRM